ncbi:MAG: potassium-transporting ATPase subunit KdpC [Hungatella sp.]
MKTFAKMFRTAFMFCLVMIVVCSVIYPMALTGISQVAMKEKANGSLIDKNGELTTNTEEAVGSELLGQAFTEDYYFHGRVSSINYNTYTQEQLDSGEYAGVASGSFNYGNSNPDLETRIQEDLDAFLASHPGIEASDIPADLLTASGSGLDPHISLEAAKVQIAAVAEHSGLGEEVITQIVENNTEYKTAGIFGEDRVNVLKCNLEIAKAMGIL